MKKLYLSQIITGFVIVFLFFSAFGYSINGFEEINNVVKYKHVIFQGDGTVDDPFLIEDVFQLQDMNLDLYAHYELVNDIDASETNGWNNGLGFMPIGTWSTQSFQGSFYGNNFTITGLYINRPDEDLVGLFGYVGPSGIISYVGLIDAYVSSGKYQCVGTLVGCNQGLVSNCYATGYVYGGYRVGGLVGENNPGTVQYSHASVNVTAFENRIGGLVGFNWNGYVYNSYATGSVQGKTYVGGLVGRNYYAEILNCYATGDVTGGSCVGGLTGNSEDSIIENCYALGSVTGSWAVGGLLGYSWGASLSNSYAMGAVNSNSDVGGLVGYLFISTVDKCYSIGDVYGNSEFGGLVGTKATGGVVVNSFWDIETSGLVTSDGGTGKTSQEMQSIQTFTDLSTVGLDDAWDMRVIEEYEDEIWFIDDGVDYPGLGWSLFDGELNNPPVFGMPNPENGSTGNPLSFVWNIPIYDLEGDRFSWTIECSNGQSSSGSFELNGTKTLHLTYLKPSSTYIVWVNATDSIGSGQYTRAWYIFSVQSSGLDIVNITGGFGIEAVVINTGDMLIESIQWSIQIDGGFIISARNTSGTILALDVDAQRSIRSKKIFGLGQTNITINAKSGNEVEVSKTVQAFILFIFILLN
ncbi:MAG: GLUG motif-containing protein [Thermoplasmatota archaeon]